MGKNIIKSITRTLVRTYGSDGGLTLKMTINLESDGLSKYSTNAVTVNSNIGDEMSTHTISLSASPLLILASGAKDAWPKYGSQGCVFITAKSKRAVVKMMKKMWKKCLTDKIFFTDGPVCKVYAPPAGKTFSESMVVGKNSTLTLTPVIVTDIDETTYEGIRVTMGGEVTVDLVMDDYELLYRTLKNMDIFLYSQALLNFYVGYKEKFDPTIGGSKPFKIENSRAAQDALQEKLRDEETVTATLKNPTNVKSDDGFGGIGKVEPTA